MGADPAGIHREHHGLGSACRNSASPFCGTQNVLPKAAPVPVPHCPRLTVPSCPGGCRNSSRNSSRNLLSSFPKAKCSSQHFPFEVQTPRSEPQTFSREKGSGHESLLFGLKVFHVYLHPSPINSPSLTFDDFPPLTSHSAIQKHFKQLLKTCIIV